MIQADFPEFLWIWNRQQGVGTPNLHLKMARWMADSWRSGDRRLLLMAFRSAGKSTTVGLFAAWLFSIDPDIRILVMAADHALARRMVRNVKRILERHPLTRHLKPDRADQWASDQFTVRRTREQRDPSMLAKGIGANVTGSRADLIICDDVEVPNTCNNPAKRTDLRARLHELDYVLVPGGGQLYVGTPHTFYTIYADRPRKEIGEEAAFLDGFSRLELPIIDADGNSLWPERFPLAAIERVKDRTGPAKFQSQMMLKPVNIRESRLDPDRIRIYDQEMVMAECNGEFVLNLRDVRMLSASCWWDPSYGSPTGGDASVIAAVFTGADGNHYLHGVRYLSHDIGGAGDLDEATAMCRQVVEFVRELHLPSVRLETNGIGRFLPGLLRREMTAAGVGAAVVERTSSRNKVLRIIDAFDALLAAGRLFAHASVTKTPFFTEMREWTADGRGADDGLDAVAGCLLDEPVRLPRLPPPDPKDVSPSSSWARGRGRFQAKTDFQL